ncbi:hypothetical protein [Mycolicibacterium goodii]|uniref:hypothetical protein n=1 Tax=Mycolicibacterium goodii TaxID=134601 RepID=UPI001BDBD910|nr:hypothetical protein [Mycolicibacterium goodii]MBU8839099.1 hypothetical protein [Mycolicibacterium goodii]
MGGVVGHANGERSMVRVPRMRRRCPCGCGRTSTHSGLGTNGVALMWGCELHVRRWVRDGYTPEMMGWQLGADGFYRKNGVAVLTAEQQRQLIDDVHSGEYTVSDLMQRYPFESEAALNATVERLQESNARPGRPELRPTQ